MLLRHAENRIDASLRSGPDEESGFTIVEVLVALLVLALSLSVLFDIISISLGRVGNAEKLTEATLVAQSVLARVGADMPLQEGETAGRYDNGLRWRVHVKPFGDAADRQAWPVTPYEISAEILWAEGARERSIILTTLRLGPKTAAR
jgi:general secretion pathway protein I